ALDQAVAANAEMAVLGQRQQPKPLKFFRRLPHVATIGWQLARLYFMKPINAEQMRTVVR
ncbi:MAG: magnesium-protoporphyrin IX monomethyl ester cyclase, partial [Cyanobacteria bacterium P01_D01_bin.115]